MWASLLIILVLYVDDLILNHSDPNLINHVKSSLKNQFEITDLGHLHYFLGLQVLQSKEGISLSQSKYACDLLCHFHMENCKPTPSPFHFGVNYVCFKVYNIYLMVYIAWFYNINPLGLLVHWV